MQIPRRTVLQTLSTLPLLCSPAIVAAATVNMRLALYMDDSGSMYTPDKNRNYIKHATIQLDGHINALRDPMVRNLLISNRVEVVVILWSGGKHLINQIASVVIDSPVAIEFVISKMKQEVPNYGQANHSTIHYSALEAALDLLQGTNQLIVDISTDQGFPMGKSNIGGHLNKSAFEASTALSVRGAQVNVLAVDVTPTEKLELSTNVQTPDGFTLEVSWEQYAQAIRDKMVQELLRGM